jgi:hypothetical protein
VKKLALTFGRIFEKATDFGGLFGIERQGRDAQGPPLGFLLGVLFEHGPLLGSGMMISGNS